jgi:hypothetical protein
MRGSRNETKSRDEIRERVDRTAEDMDNRGAVLDERRVDVEALRVTVENMDFGGTSDAIEIMENALDGAEDVVVETFDRESDELDDVQADNAEHGEELHERSDADRGDAERISETSGSISTRESVNELTRARDALLEDIDRLLEQIDRSKEVGQRSEELQNSIANIMQSGGRARR